MLQGLLPWLKKCLIEAIIFITHNKISMEKSDHLMGVTMQEAGVSRVVSVDVKEALKLAAS